MTVDGGHQRFVKATYTDFLNRQPTPNELTFQTATLQNRSQTRGQMTNAVAGTTEGVSAFVNKLYQDTLGRPGDPGGINYWTSEIRSGRRSVADVVANFYASPEHFGAAGGTNQSWVRDLYRRLLLREPDQGGLNYWTNETATRGPINVALRIYDSQESRAVRVNNLYVKLLARPADPGGSAYWSARIQTEGDITLAANLASSQEYFDRAQTRFP